jgi:hypothetical protein
MGRIWHQPWDDYIGVRRISGLWVFGGGAAAISEAILPGHWSNKVVRPVVHALEERGLPRALPPLPLATKVH